MSVLKNSAQFCSDTFLHVQTTLFFVKGTWCQLSKRYKRLEECVSVCGRKKLLTRASPDGHKRVTICHSNGCLQSKVSFVTRHSRKLLTDYNSKKVV
jgi:hypothetical protein